MTASAIAFVWCVIQVTVLALGAALIYLAARRLHPRAGVAAAGGSLAMVLVLTAMAVSPWPRWSLSTGPSDSGVARPAVTLTTTQTSHAENVENVPAAKRAAAVRFESPQQAFWAALVDGLNDPHTPIAKQPQTARWAPLLACVFATGIALAAARLAWGVAMVRRLAQRGRMLNDAKLLHLLNELQTRLELRGAVEVRESDELATAATVGWWRPVVLLPSTWRDWNEDELRAAMSHELAHIAGRDYASWLVARVALVAHFYHPVVRWLATRLQLEQELAADMTAARLMGDPQRYLRSLASLALATPAQQVAGPVRTLIPNRSLLVRRVDMLRSLGGTRPGRTTARYATFAVVALVGIGAAGLRGPVIALQTAQAEPVNYDITNAVDWRIGLEVVPADVVYVLSARPAQIARDKDAAELLKTFTELNPEFAEAKLQLSDIADLMFMTYGSLQKQQFRIVAQFTGEEHKQHYLDYALKHGLTQVPGEQRWKEKNGRGHIAELNSTTLVFDAITTPDGQAAPLKNALPRWAEEWTKQKDRPLVAAIDISGPFAPMREELSEVPVFGGAIESEARLYLAMIAPIINHGDWAVAAAKFDETLSFQGTIHCDSPEATHQVRDTLDAVVALAKNMTQHATDYVNSDPPGAEKTKLAFAARLYQIVGKFLDSAEFITAGNNVNVSLKSDLSSAQVVAMAKNLLPTVKEARTAARQTQSMHNLKQLVVTMLVHADINKALPPAAGYAYRKNGQTLTSKYPHSWRVEMLQYMELNDLYDQYNFDEPWDSEANKKVLAQIPDVYRSPLDPDPTSVNTSYFAITGPETIFDKPEGTKLQQITDGTSHTILLVEAKRDVPWTKPEDIEYAADKPLPKLGGWTPGYFLVALADGSVQRLPENVDPKELRAFITKADDAAKRNAPPPPRTNGPEDQLFE